MGLALRLSLVLATLAATAVPHLATQSCQPEWKPTFGERPGLDGTVHAFATFDDGSGPVLYVGGQFSRAGATLANDVARWDGARWSAVGSGPSSASAATVRALAVFDDGSGPALYAGLELPGLSAPCLARWDGTSWTDVATMTHNQSTLGVYALAVFDDGSGPALYCGGRFKTVAGVDAPYFARFDGTVWSAVAEAPAFEMNALTVWDDGSGPALYAGGKFTSTSGLDRIARWDGSTWSDLAGGMSALVDALAVHDDGSGAGPQLYAGGKFLLAGGVSARRVARWDGTNWSALGAGLDDDVEALFSFDDGGGPALYAGGAFHDAGIGTATNCVARWRSGAWGALGSGMTSDVRAFAAFDQGDGPRLFAGGSFGTGVTDALSRVARLEAGGWAPLGNGLDAPVLATVAFDDGTGPALIAGGAFTRAGSALLNHVAKWTDTGWVPLGTGVSAQVRALAVFDRGNGPELYAGGDSGLRRWNGATWLPPSGGLNGQVRVLAVGNVGGTGDALYVGGAFTTGGLSPVQSLARHDGFGFSALGSGTNADITALAVVDDGSGPALIVGGPFTSAGGAPANRVARWDGTGWSPLGDGFNAFSFPRVFAMFDDGSGPALYAGGSFSSTPLSWLARWDGVAWNHLGANDVVAAFAVFDDGSGPALYAGGEFTSVAGVPASHVARWNGTSWSAVDLGQTSDVLTLAVLDDDVHAPALYAGGAFLLSTVGDSHLARYQGCLDTEPPTLACPDPVVALDALVGPPGRVVTFTVTAWDNVDPLPSVVCTPPSGSFFPPGTTLVSCTATDATGNQAQCSFSVTVQPKALKVPR